MDKKQLKYFFETWASDHYMCMLPAREGGAHKDYHSGVTQRSWDAWQTAHELGLNDDKININKFDIQDEHDKANFGERVSRCINE